MEIFQLASFWKFQGLSIGFQRYGTETTNWFELTGFITVLVFVTGDPAEILKITCFDQQRNQLSHFFWNLGWGNRKPYILTTFLFCQSMVQILRDIDDESLFQYDYFYSKLKFNQRRRAQIYFS